MSDVVIAVDVGGTTIAGGLVTPAGEVLTAISVPMRAAAGATVATIGTLIDDLRRTAADRPVLGIGVGVPGPVDTVAGRIGEHVPHAPDLAEQPLASLLAARFRLPVYVDNDVNALALGEWRFGAARGVGSLVVLAPGTGFGTGVVLDGRLVRGVAGFGGEFGHTPVNFDGPRCFCGLRGCLALYASGRGVADAARARARADDGAALLRAVDGDAAAMTAELVFRLAAAGDAAASAIVEEACRAIAAMLGTIVNGLNPEAIVITGGLVESLVALEPRILAAARDYAFSRPLAATRITWVRSDKRTTMRGAAALVLYESALAGEAEARPRT
jgi:glucokinase